MGTFVGFYQIINFTKSNKKIQLTCTIIRLCIIHTPKWSHGDGQRNKWTDKRTNKRTNIYSIFRDKLSLPEGTSDSFRCCLMHAVQLILHTITYHTEHNHTWIASNNAIFCMSCYYHSHLIIPYLDQILGFWVICGVKWCHYVMDEANSHLNLLPTSLLDIYKVFEHIDMLSMGIQYQPYTVNPTLLGSDFWVLGHM